MNRSCCDILFWLTFYNLWIYIIILFTLWNWLFNQILWLFDRRNNTCGLKEILFLCSFLYCRVSLWNNLLFYRNNNRLWLSIFILYFLFNLLTIGYIYLLYYRRLLYSFCYHNRLLNYLWFNRNYLWGCYWNHLLIWMNLSLFFLLLDCLSFSLIYRLFNYYCCCWFSYWFINFIIN